MIVDIDLLPSAESIDKDRCTYPTITPNFLPSLLCVRHGNRTLVRLRLTAKRKNHPALADSHPLASPKLEYFYELSP
jgi:hypothetical protein